jgi:hypothetical protein
MIIQSNEERESDDIFNQVFYRSAARVAKQETKPDAYRVRFDCGHVRDLSVDTIQRNMVSVSKTDARTGGRRIEMICPACKAGERGACQKTAIHQVQDFTPLPPFHRA